MAESTDVFPNQVVSWVSYPGSVSRGYCCPISTFDRVVNLQVVALKSLPSPNLSLLRFHPHQSSRNSPPEATVTCELSLIFSSFHCKKAFPYKPVSILWKPLMILDWPHLYSSHFVAGFSVMITMVWWCPLSSLKILTLSTQAHQGWGATNLAFIFQNLKTMR